jgi:hypothetical protein
MDGGGYRVPEEGIGYRVSGIGDREPRAGEEGIGYRGPVHSEVPGTWYLFTRYLLPCLPHQLIQHSRDLRGTLRSG